MAKPRTTAAITRSQRPRISDQELYERVTRKAYELYQQRGEAPGDELADGLLAERLVQEELLHGPVPEEPLADDETE